MQDLTTEHRILDYGVPKIAGMTPAQAAKHRRKEAIAACQRMLDYIQDNTEPLLWDGRISSISVTLHGQPK